MKRILSERNFVIVLFVFAFAFFIFAQQDAKKVERMYMVPGNDVSSLVPRSKKTTENISSAPAEKVIITKRLTR